jgi:transcriptional regulator with XRE-family HTH domain
VTDSHNGVMNIYKVVGANIRRYRQKKNMTQIELAVAADMDRSFLAKIEGGSRNFTLGVLHNLSVALGVRILDLLEGVR